MAPPTQPWRHEIDRLDDRVTTVHDTIQTHLPRIASLEYRCADINKHIDAYKFAHVKSKMSQLEIRPDAELQRDNRV